MARPPAPKAQRARVIKAVLEDGLSFRAAAAKCRVSAPTVKRWVDEEKKRAEPPLVPLEGEAEPEAPGPAQPPPGASTLEVTRWMRDDALHSARQAKSSHNYTAAASFSSHAAKLAPVIRQLEKSDASDGDGVRYSRAQLDEATASVLAKIAALAARPLHCAACARELSVELAGYDPKVIEEGRKKGH